MNKFRVVHFTDFDEPNPTKKEDYTFHEAERLVQQAMRLVAPGEEYIIQVEVETITGEKEWENVPSYNFEKYRKECI